MLLTSAATKEPSKIIRLVAGLPFDVAAEAGFLIFGRGFASKRGVQRGAQVLAGHRRPLPGRLSSNWPR